MNMNSDKPMKTYIVYVMVGYNYEYDTEIQATSVFDARKKYAKMEAGWWKSRNFKVSEKRT